MPKQRPVLFHEIASVCYEAKRYYLSTVGDYSMPPISRASDADAAPIIATVLEFCENPNLHSIDIHQRWLDAKTAEGWTHGKTISVAEKKHPLILPYEDLPDHIKTSDRIVEAIAKSMLKDSPCNA